MDYKHKITGNIAKKTNSGKNYKVSEPKHFTIPSWIVENSEEWGQISEEREYIVLSVSNKSNNKEIKKVKVWDWGNEDAYLEERPDVYYNGKG